LKGQLAWVCESVLMTLDVGKGQVRWPDRCPN
jgi:hypothetical protein